MAYAIVQFQLLDINVALKRSLISALILAGLLVPCYLILISSQQLAFGSIDIAFSLLTLSLLAAAGFLFPRFRFIGEDALERALFTNKTDHHETLLQSSREMVTVVDLSELSERLVRTASHAVGIDKAACTCTTMPKTNSAWPPRWASSCGRPATRCWGTATPWFKL